MLVYAKSVLDTRQMIRDRLRTLNALDFKSTRLSSVWCQDLAMRTKRCPDILSASLYTALAEHGGIRWGFWFVQSCIHARRVAGPLLLFPSPEPPVRAVVDCEKAGWLTEDGVTGPSPWEARKAGFDPPADASVRFGELCEAMNEDDKGANKIEFV